MASSFNYPPGGVQELTRDPPIRIVTIILRVQRPPAWGIQISTVLTVGSRGEGSRRGANVRATIRPHLRGESTSSLRRKAAASFLFCIFVWGEVGGRWPSPIDLRNTISPEGGPPLASETVIHREERPLREPPHPDMRNALPFRGLLLSAQVETKHVPPRDRAHGTGTSPKKTLHKNLHT